VRTVAHSRDLAADIEDRRCKGSCSTRQASDGKHQAHQPAARGPGERRRGTTKPRFRREKCWRTGRRRPPRSGTGDSSDAQGPGGKVSAVKRRKNGTGQAEQASQIPTRSCCSSFPQTAAGRCPGQVEQGGRHGFRPAIPGLPLAAAIGRSPGRWCRRGCRSRSHRHAEQTDGKGEQQHPPQVPAAVLESEADQSQVPRTPCGIGR